MSILICGMEMPKSCDKCELMTANYGCVFVGAVGGESYRKRPFDCPLTEVPTPHGRLIDADALAEQYAFAQEQRGKDKTDYSNAFMNNGELCTEWWCVEDMLENAPTILESEEGE